MRHSESIAAISAALCKAQAELGHAHKGSLNPHFKNRYADLTEVIDTVRPALTSHGITFAQFPGYEAGVTTVETILMHESGEWISGIAGARVSKDDPQGVGSAITYLRRYSLASVCGIGQEDDDGEAASQATKASAKKSQRVPKLRTPAEDATIERGRALWIEAAGMGLDDDAEPTSAGLAKLDSALAEGDVPTIAKAIPWVESIIKKAKEGIPV